MTDPVQPLPRVPTGIAGLDRVLHGGLLAGRTCLVRGAAGTGKTTLALEFLREGLRRQERCLYLTLLQSEGDLTDVAASHGWSLDGLDTGHLPEQTWTQDEQTLFSAFEVELVEITSAISDFLERYRPERLVIDSLGELAMLVESPHQLRRALLRLKLEIDTLGCTALVTIADSALEISLALETLFQGVLHLHAETALYGRNHRSLEAVKQRGAAFAEGWHDLTIRTGALEVYPRLEASERDSAPARSSRREVGSGVAELDQLTGGGLQTGTSCLIAGTSGAGKSTIASLYAESVASQGGRAAVYCFDERRETFLSRATGLGLHLADHVEQGRVELRELSVGEVTAGQFAAQVCEAVSERGVEVVIIDSVTGYLHAMTGVQEVIVQLHELVGFLSKSRVLTLLIVNDHGLQPDRTEIDASYLTDSVLLLRHFEAHGAMHRCLAVLKKRDGQHEQTIRQFRTDGDGVHVGPPLRQFRGVLSGSPVYVGERQHVMNGGEATGAPDAGHDPA